MQRKHFVSRILLCLILISLVIGAFYVANTIKMQKELEQQTFRLHILANSNNEEDQLLKLKVRDKILGYLSKQDLTDKTETEQFVKSNLDVLEDIALDTIKEEGYDYTVETKIGKIDFPTKNYGDVSLPAGNYDGLKVEIGKAQGDNWWCVMFPPLCFVDVSSGVVPEESKEILKDNLNEETYSFITDKENPSVEIKFKFLELFQRTIMAARIDGR